MEKTKSIVANEGKQKFLDKTINFMRNNGWTITNLREATKEIEEHFEDNAKL